MLRPSLQQLVQTLQQSLEIDGFCLEGGIWQTGELEADGLEVELGGVQHVPRLFDEISCLPVSVSVHDRSFQENMSQFQGYTKSSYSPHGQIILDFGIMEEELKTRLPIYILMGITSILGSYLFLSWTAHDGLADFVRIFYAQRTIKNSEQELTILANTSYYFTIIVLLSYAAAASYKGLFAKKEQSGEVLDPPFTRVTKHALHVVFYSFLIFVACFYHLLRNDGDALSRRYINLLPFWFLSVTVVFLVGSWLSIWAKLSIYVNGVIVGVILWALILGQIYNNGFIHQWLNL